MADSYETTHFRIITFDNSPFYFYHESKLQFRFTIKKCLYDQKKP